jgi:hypothetical protein
MPDLVLYADGRIILTRVDWIADQNRRTIVEARLTHDEVCGFLAQIETDGFFDFGPQEYVAPEITDDGETLIRVRAWRSNEISAYALPFAIYDNAPEAQVPTALAKTYERLSNFRPLNVALYQPDHLALLIYRFDAPEVAPLWPLPSPTLAELSRQLSQNSNEVLLEGQEAADVYSLFDGEITRAYSENGQTYELTIRPLLPLEVHQPGRGWSPPPEFPSTPTTEMTCDPSSGTPWPTVNVPATLPARMNLDAIPSPTSSQVPLITIVAPSATPPPASTPNAALEPENQPEYLTSFGRYRNASD